MYNDEKTQSVSDKAKNFADQVLEDLAGPKFTKEEQVQAFHFIRDGLINHRQKWAAELASETEKMNIFREELAKGTDSL